MPTRLKNRNKQIPNGFKFLQAETGWSPPRYSSFTQIVNGLIHHRKGNRAMAEKNGWSIEPIQVEQEVEAYNVKVCQQHGWNDYISEGAESLPKSSPPQRTSLLQLGRRAVAGAETLSIDWLASGAEAVAITQAEDRARVCVVCPLNKRGDLLSFFTVPVTNAIRAAISLKNEWKLVTPDDDHLGVCQACSCPLRLKVHLPIADILKRMPEESYDQLDLECWIRKEKDGP